MVLLQPGPWVCPRAPGTARIPLWPLLSGQLLSREEGRGNPPGLEGKTVLAQLPWAGETLSMEPESSRSGRFPAPSLSFSTRRREGHCTVATCQPDSEGLGEPWFLQPPARGALSRWAGPAVLRCALPQEAGEWSPGTYRKQSTFLVNSVCFLLFLI